jgi:hypothetical protein
MKQRVELYQGRFRAGRRLLSARHIVWTGALCALLLGLVFGWGQWRAGRQARALDSLREEAAQAAQRIVQLAETHPPARADRALQVEVERRENERAAKSELLRLLSSQSLGNTQGFSPHLTALARRRVNGVWLREIRLVEGGGELWLAGSALEPELVPRLLQHLRDEAPFAGTTFRRLRVERAADDAGYVDFGLDTSGEAEQ